MRSTPRQWLTIRHAAIGAAVAVTGIGAVWGFGSGPDALFAVDNSVELSAPTPPNLAHSPAAPADDLYRDHHSINVEGGARAVTDYPTDPPLGSNEVPMTIDPPTSVATPVLPSHESDPYLQSVTDSNSSPSDGPRSDRLSSDDFISMQTHDGSGGTGGIQTAGNGSGGGGSSLGDSGGGSGDGGGGGGGGGDSDVAEDGVASDEAGQDEGAALLAEPNVSPPRNDDSGSDTTDAPPEPEQDEVVTDDADEDVSDPEPSTGPSVGLSRPSTPSAFPGAEGAGQWTVGGRGGDLYPVTNLEDAGPGSLRYGIENAMGHRTIVFRVAGTIYLKTPLVIRSNYLTIAGQSAPGRGITVAGQPVEIRDASHVVLRFLRFRLGDINAATRESGEQNGRPVTAREGKGLRNVVGSAGDALRVLDSNNVIIDHVSASWSIDETLSVGRSRAVTVQNCLIAESLNDSYHEKGLHGYGSLLVGGPNIGTGYSFVRNLFMHHHARNPALADRYAMVDETGSLKVEFVNNISYNWGFQALHIGSGTEFLYLNLTGNLFVAGPDSPSITQYTFRGLTDYPFFERDNLMESTDGNRTDLFQNPFLMGWQMAVPRYDQPAVELYQLGAIESWIVEHVGCSLSRDPVDERLIQEYTDRSGRIINSQQDVGGFPDDVTAPQPDPDTDGDGMPDRWELDHDLDPNDIADRNSLRSDGRTALESYLNGLVTDYSPPVAAQVGFD